MNKQQLILLLLIAICMMASCSKDDLCIPEDAATPRLIVVFVDANNGLLRKPVEQLEIYETGNDSVAITLNGLGETSLTEVDSIAIPLRIDPDTGDRKSTQFDFVRTLATIEISSTIDFEYLQNEIYINRACGFQAIFNELDANLETPPINGWITSLTVQQRDVTSNNDIHVEIRH